MSQPYRANRCPSCLGAAIAFFLFSSLSKAAVFNVTSNADAGPGTLRAAVAEANALPGADTITIEPLQPIELDGTQITVTDNLTITGPAMGVGIVGRGSSRIFGVTTPGTSLRIERLVLTEGYASAGNAALSECGPDTLNGGAICSLGPLEIIESSITLSLAVGGSGGGIWVRSPSAVLIEDSHIGDNSATFGNGGGIYAATNALTVINSRILGNGAQGNNNDASVAAGGGIYFDGDGAGPGSVLGDLTVIRSEIAGNSTGGLNGDGGGIWTQGQTVLSNTTVSGNRTQGTIGDGAAIYSAGGNLEILASTLTNNTSAAGGAVEIDDGAGTRTASIESSILAGNSGPSGNLLYLGGITVNASASVFGDAAGEINGISAFNEFTDNPLLDSLADNGCFTVAGIDATLLAPQAGCVRTHALQLGSPAIDNGNDLGDATDQRGQGFARVVGDRADAGAYERSNVALPPGNPGNPGNPGVATPNRPGTGTPHAVPALTLPAFILLCLTVIGVAGRRLAIHASTRK